MLLSSIEAIRIRLIRTVVLIVERVGSSRRLEPTKGNELPWMSRSSANSSLHGTICKLPPCHFERSEKSKKSGTCANRISRLRLEMKFQAANLQRQASGWVAPLVFALRGDPAVRTNPLQHASLLPVLGAI